MPTLLDKHILGRYLSDCSGGTLLIPAIKNPAREVCVSEFIAVRGTLCVFLLNLPDFTVCLVCLRSIFDLLNGCCATGSCAIDNILQIDLWWHDEKAIRLLFGIPWIDLAAPDLKLGRHCS